ncbi:DUF445 domain-containing protein [Hoeflea poritis]|uniref:DUF445 domain-containing protein n=1 Tax=Hoeflea poritis TaxID=2993659 RepID=A0ABT4VK94_9HYPH|nr:DUF445 domain-containing protein [Hoeflea poritis]MDA4845147.1 DUF445 domain-containing protein [Hoeflea poritis]
MHRVATGALVGLIAIYLGTFLIEHHHWLIGLVRAAAGAGVVGALADWFAVVALFRHPLGMPIPHTALLPRNQNRVADNVGRFIKENFLRPELVAEKIRGGGFSSQLASWVVDGAQSGFIRQTLQTIARVLRADTPEPLHRLLADLIRKASQEKAGHAGLAQEISRFLEYGLRGDALSEIVVYMRDTVHRNRREVDRLVRANSRWWIASRVDRNVSDMIVNSVLSVLDDLAQPDGALRADFEHLAGSTIRDLTKSRRLQSLIEQASAGYVNSKSFENRLRHFVDAAKNQLADYAESDAVVAEVQIAVGKMAENVLNNPEMQRSLDDKAAETIAGIIPVIRPAVAAFVTQTISEWDPDVLVERFEAEAGRDLQFIRINGAILGAMIGGALFAIERALA